MTELLANVRTLLDELYRTQSRRIFASLVRLLQDFDLAEEALHDAFTLAAEHWPLQGIPTQPRAWLISTGRFQAIDKLRRRVWLNRSAEQVAQRLEAISQSNATASDYEISDDRLRLILTCCHPAIPDSTRAALTLREVCGLTTEEIARAFLTAPSTMAQRIVRGKARIREQAIPYEIPAVEELPPRLDSVLAVIYLVFNEGYAASTGESLTRPDLCHEAIRLGRLLGELLPDPEVTGLLALMLLQSSRQQARTTASGDLILLEHQDRSLWDHTLAQEGISLVQQVLATGTVGTYTLQAAIAAVHAQAKQASETNWHHIVAYYDLLRQAAASPVVELNRAVAIAMRDGPAAGLVIIEPLLERGELTTYHLTHAARADLHRRLGDIQQAIESYRLALHYVQQEPERRFLQQQLQKLSEAQSTPPTS